MVVRLLTSEQSEDDVTNHRSAPPVVCNQLSHWSGRTRCAVVPMPWHTLPFGHQTISEPLPSCCTSGLHPSEASSRCAPSPLVGCLVGGHVRRRSSPHLYTHGSGASGEHHTWPRTRQYARVEMASGRPVSGCIDSTSQIAAAAAARLQLALMRSPSSSRGPRTATRDTFAY